MTSMYQQWRTTYDNLHWTKMTMFSIVRWCLISSHLHNFCTEDEVLHLDMHYLPKEKKSHALSFLLSSYQFLEEPKALQNFVLLLYKIITIQWEHQAFFFGSAVLRVLFFGGWSVVAFLFVTFALPFFVAVVGAIGLEVGRLDMMNVESGRGANGCFLVLICED